MIKTDEERRIGLLFLLIIKSALSYERKSKTCGFVSSFELYIYILILRLKIRILLNFSIDRFGFVLDVTNMGGFHGNWVGVGLGPNPRTPDGTSADRDRCLYTPCYTSLALPVPEQLRWELRRGW